MEWNWMILSAAKPTLLQINKCNYLFLKVFFSCEHCTVLPKCIYLFNTK